MVVDFHRRTHQGLRAEFRRIVGVFAHVDDGKGGHGQAVFIFPLGLGRGRCLRGGLCATEREQCAKKVGQETFHHEFFGVTTNKYKKKKVEIRHKMPQFAPESADFTTITSSGLPNAREGAYLCGDNY